jgi:putative membrane protein
MNRRNLIAGALAFSMAMTVVDGQTPREPAPALTDARTFITQMAIAGMAEVQLGKLATERAENAEVKAFGQMMAKDHTQANAELAQVAKQMNVQVPTQLDQKHRDLIDRLSKLRGAAFDREYMSAMVPGHEEVAAKLRAQGGTQTQSTSPRQGTRSVGTSGSQSDQALAQWAAKALPTVEQHLARAKELQQKVR